jgi:hypothetical protein
MPAAISGIPAPGTRLPGSSWAAAADVPAGLRAGLEARVRVARDRVGSSRDSELAADLAADLAAAEHGGGPVVPTDVDLDEFACDLDCRPPEGPEGWLAELPWPLLAEYFEAVREPAGPEPIAAGRLPRELGDGCGFAAGGVADDLPPGPTLAGLAADAWDDGLGRLSDDELIGVLRAARRLASWAAGLELAAVADLATRREDAAEAAGDPARAEHTGDEIAAALTLTGRAADTLLDLAAALGRLPATTAALAAGRIDRYKAAVIADETSGLSDEHALAVEGEILREATGQTTGQLRAATRRAVLAADPAAARRRKESAAQDARVEKWEEHAGTAALAGRDLPPAAVLAADHNLTALARTLRQAGVPATMDQLRAQVYLALLTGQPLTTLLPPPLPAPGAASDSGHPPAGPGARGTGPGSAGYGSAGPGSAGPGSAGPGSAGLGRGCAGPAMGMTGSVNLTMPLATWLGLSDGPGEAAGYGPLDADDSRALADLLAQRPGNRWCVTLTGQHGQPIGHGCTRTKPITSKDPATGPGPPHGPSPPAGPTGLAGPPGWLASITIHPLETGACSHQRQSPVYRPPPSLQHLIAVRQPTCSFPGCRRPAVGHCDQDHTIPYHQGGRTCECNLAPLCRRHHRAKQTHGWILTQPRPGEMTWTTPSSRTYITGPAAYPA